MKRDTTPSEQWFAISKDAYWPELAPGALTARPKAALEILL